MASVEVGDRKVQFSAIEVDMQVFWLYWHAPRCGNVGLRRVHACDRPRGHLGLHKTRWFRSGHEQARAVWITPEVIHYRYKPLEVN